MKYNLILFQVLIFGVLIVNCIGFSGTETNNNQSCFFEHLHYSYKNLHGQIKSVSTKSYKVEEKFGEIVKVDREWENRIDVDEELVFNEDGLLFEQRFLSKHDEVENYLKTVYSNNNFTVAAYNQNDSILYRIEGKCKNNHTVEITFYNSDMKVINKGISIYDDNRNLIEQTTINEKGDVIERMSMKYNKANKKTEQILFDSTGKIETSFQFKYNLENKTKTEIHYFKIDEISLSAKVIYKYDKYDNEIEEYRYSENDSSPSIKKYKYTYDSYGNYISKITYKDGLPQFLIERKITYY